MILSVTLSVVAAARVRQSAIDATGATGDRAATEDRLARAAVRLIERNGVLAGLNLREVAEEAGMNRGLIYHYFGNRRELLRAAIGRIVAVDRTAEDARALPFRRRRRRMFDVLAAAPGFARLTALLALDGDDRFEPFPRLEASVDDLRREVETGRLPADTDVIAVHAVTSAAMRGYAVYRDAFARSLDIPVAELDRRASVVFERMLTGLEPR
jgi:AcrR family transcriptional regulator